MNDVLRLGFKLDFIDDWKFFLGARYFVGFDVENNEKIGGIFE
jgi:hypothetical protein